MKDKPVYKVAFTATSLDNLQTLYTVTIGDFKTFASIEKMRVNLQRQNPGLSFSALIDVQSII